jgi:Tol biopolymer transport system component
VWSPDGKQLAYVSVFSGENYSAIYRKAADGSGNEELIYKHTPGSAVIITDWSKDVLCFWAGNMMYALPLNGDRKPVPLTSTKGAARGGRVSPDGRFIAYNSNESGRYEVYVAAFDPRAEISKPVQISKDGALGGIFWRQDGKELLYVNLSGLVVTGMSAVDITTGTEIRAGEPRSVFRPQGINSPAQLSNIATPDAQRFVFLPAAQATTAGR